MSVILSLLQTKKMLLFIIAFFLFILLGYEFNHAQVNGQISHTITIAPPAYMDALLDAQIPEEKEIFNHLTVIDRDNDHLIIVIN